MRAAPVALALLSAAAWGQHEGHNMAVPASPSTAENGLTADQAAAMALAHHPRVRMALAEAGLAEADLQVAGWFSDPEISLIFDVSRLDETELSVSLSDLWRLPTKRKAFGALSDAAAMDALAALSQAAAEARAAHSQAVAADTMAVLAEQRSTLMDRILTETQRRAEAGVAGPLEVAQAQAQAAFGEAERRLASAAALAARARLSAATGGEAAVDAPLSAEGRHFHASPEEARKMAIEHRPEIMAAKARLDASADFLDLARSSWSEGLMAGWKWSASSSGPTVGFRLPLGRSQAEARSAGKAQSVRLADLELVRLMVGLEAEEAAHRAMAAMMAEAAIRTDALPALEARAEQAAELFGAMQLSTLEAMHAQLDLIEGRAAAAQAALESRLAMLELRAASGRLLEKA